MNEGHEQHAYCTHLHVEYRPTGDNGVGWSERWCCTQCGMEFRPVRAQEVGAPTEEGAVVTAAFAEKEQQ